MNRILKIACLYLGLAQTVFALGTPVSVLVGGLVEKAKVYFGVTKKIDIKIPDIAPLPEIELNGLGGIHIKDLFKDETKSPHVKHSPFINHAHAIQELKERFDLLKAKVASDNRRQNVVGGKKLTQTEAYLKRYKIEVNSAFGWGHDINPVEKHKKLIDKIVAREKEFADTHYFFYHAHAKELIILQDFIKLLRGYIQVVFPRADFTTMRFKNTLTLPYKNVNEYLNATPLLNDCAEPTRSQMISTNLALFGNHPSGGECTFSYFLNNMTISSGTLEAFLKPIFSHYELDVKYLIELTDLTSYFSSSTTSNLLQICIPHDMVDDLAYLAQPWGMPYNKVVLDKYYDYTKNRHTSIRPLIEHMRTSPEAIGDLNCWQARLMFFDPMMDMHPAIKVFRYNTVTAENMALYQEKLKDIVIRLVCDYLKKVATHEVPLVKLYKSMAAHTAHDILKVA